MSPRDKEYRLIPYEPDDETDQIRISELVRIIWNARKTIVVITLAVAFYGALRSLAQPEEFTSGATIMPVVEQPTQLPGMLQQFGGVLGAADFQFRSSQEINVRLYPEILYSTPAMYHLIYQEVAVPGTDRTVSVMEYMLEHREISTVARTTGFLLDYTIHLPVTVVRGAYRLFRSALSFVIGESPQQTGGIRSPQGGETPTGITRTRLTVDEANFIDDMKDRISTQYNSETGLFRFEMRMPDAEIAAQLNETMLNFLTDYVTDYRTGKQARNLEFITERHRIAEEEYLEAQRRLSEFRDRNIQLTSARARAEEDRLVSEYQLRFDLYNIMRQRKEEARIRLEEETPVFSIMEPVSVPSGRSSPRRVFTVVIFAFAGGFLALFWIFFRHTLRPGVTSRSGPGRPGP